MTRTFHIDDTHPDSEKLISKLEKLDFVKEEEMDDFYENIDNQLVIEKRLRNYRTGDSVPLSWAEAKIEIDRILK